MEKSNNNNTNGNSNEGDATALSPEIVAKIKLLEAKYASMGQDLRSYLDGLLYADYLTYWDYIRLDVLLNLQQPITPFKDEMIFIIYHQITELYFKLTLHATKQVLREKTLTAAFFTEQVRRINSYFKSLIHSFDIMVDGMDKDQFLQFRMSLLPASGFQSAQYRMIEIYATDLINLVALDSRAKVQDGDITAKYDHLYWKRGASELATGKKTLTLRQFELKYSERFIRIANKCKIHNLWQAYLRLPEAEQKNERLIHELRQFDINANVHWPLMHYKSAVRYLQRDPNDIAATGGTNWQKYLPPKNQRIVFYPQLWTKEELTAWGKKVQEEIFGNFK